DDGVVAGDAALGQRRGEPGAVDVVARHRVVEVGVPVEVDGARDVPGRVQQHVLVRLHDGETRLPEVLRQPGGGDQPLRVRVVGERGVGGSGKAHGVKSGTTTARVRGRTGAAHLVGTTRLATRDLVRRCRA